MTTANGPYLYAGAESSGLYRLAAGGDSWQELTAGLPDNPQVCGIAIHPEQPAVVYAGTQNGPYRSDDHGGTWQRLDYPQGAPPVWTFLFRPGNPSVMYLGTAPGEIYRSIDGGDSWSKLNAPMGSNEIAMAFPTRVIALAADPSFPDELYAALEVAGVIRSLDGGDTWQEITNNLAGNEDTLDLHGVQCAAALPRTPFITTRQGPFIGADRGAEWLPVEFGQFSEITYTRDLKAAPNDPNMLYVSIGAAARSKQGALYRSRDLFKTFERVGQGLSAASTMMAVSLDRNNQANIACAARDGQVFRTADEGASWQTVPLPEKAREVRGLALG